MTRGTSGAAPSPSGRSRAGEHASQLRRSVAEQLAAAGVASPDAEARWLVDAFADDPVALDLAVGRRMTREPLQLILGTAAFRYLDVEVAPGVFIPRPETEVLVTLALQRLVPGAVVVEPCTGTGAVACSIAAEADPGLVLATDVDAAAVALARRNAAALPRVEVRHGDLFGPLPADLRGRVDAVVCNPPYLTAQQVADAEVEVREHDPTTALVGGLDGRAVIERLVADAAGWLRPGGFLLIEDDPSRVALTARDLSAAGFVDPEIHEDLTGRSRFALGRLG